VDASSPNRKSDILRAAGKLFVNQGYHATSLSQVAAAVGMLKGSLYYHIESKEELLSEILLDWIDAAEANLASLRAADKRRQRLETILRAHVEYLCTHHGLGLLLREAVRLPRFRRDAISTKLDGYEASLGEVIRGAQRRGMVAPGNTQAIVRLLIVACTQPLFGEHEAMPRPHASECIVQLLFAANRFDTAAADEAGLAARESVEDGYAVA
jgi:TetR/AcrR family transcriptional regulator, cholesterol catabolism regulator